MATLLSLGATSSFSLQRRPLKVARSLRGVQKRLRSNERLARLQSKEVVTFSRMVWGWPISLRRSSFACAQFVTGM